MRMRAPLIAAAIALVVLSACQVPGNRFPTSPSHRTPPPAATSGADVLRIGSATGPDVAAPRLHASVAAIDTPTLYCSGGDITLVVAANPTAPGTAQLDVHALTLNDCAITTPEFPDWLPVDMVFGSPGPITIADSPGLPVRAASAGYTFSFLGDPLCSYSASIAGTYSNADNTIRVTLHSEPAGSSGKVTCPGTGDLPLTIGPVLVQNRASTPAVYAA